MTNFNENLDEILDSLYIEMLGGLEVIHDVVG